MLTIAHSKYPDSRERRSLRIAISETDTTFPPPYIMAAMRLQFAIDVGAKMALADNGILIKWPEDCEDTKTGAFEAWVYSENENNYLIDLVTPVLK